MKLVYSFEDDMKKEVMNLMYRVVFIVVEFSKEVYFDCIFYFCKILLVY